GGCKRASQPRCKRGERSSAEEIEKSILWRCYVENIRIIEQVNESRKPLIKPLDRCEEEGFVFENRTAYRTSVLLAVEGRDFFVRREVEGITRIESVIAEVTEYASMK